MNNLEYRIFYRRNLPHYQPPGATLFITSRLANSLPRKFLEKLGTEADKLKKRINQIENQDRKREELLRLRKLLFAKWDEVLDITKSGPSYLGDPRIAKIVFDSLCYRDSNVYGLEAFCIMHNHTHLVCKPLPTPDGKYHAISKIMHSFKRYTAIQANEILGRKGQFWQHENYDHVIRSDTELHRVILYVINNPVKAGLVSNWEDWEWTYCKYDY